MFSDGLAAKIKHENMCTISGNAVQGHLKLFKSLHEIFGHKIFAIYGS